MAASDDVGEERGATGDRGYCKDSKRSACPEARVFPVSSVITSGAPWAHWPRMVSVVVVFADEPGCSREMGLGSLTLASTVVLCYPKSPQAGWSVVGGFWMSIAGVLCSRSRSMSKYIAAAWLLSSSVVSTSKCPSVLVARSFELAWLARSAAGERR